MSVTLAPPPAAFAISLALAGLPTYWSQEQAYDTCQAVRETLAAAKPTPLSPLQGCHTRIDGGNIRTNG